MPSVLTILAKVRDEFETLNFKLKMLKKTRGSGNVPNCDIKASKSCHLISSQISDDIWLMVVELPSSSALFNFPT